MIFIDAHTHIHDCFDLDQFFNFCKANFTKLSARKNIDSAQTVLFLTESHKINVFNRLFNSIDNLDSWTIHKTENENSLCLIDRSNYKIFIIAGRQIVTSEKLEVLALGLDQDIDDGNKIEDVIIKVIERKNIPVIPWGVGKWVGTRGRTIENLISQSNFKILFLGDNGNRPFFWKKSKLFELALKKGILNIPGSDPLPFNSEVKKPGSFGFILQKSFDEQNPYDSLYEIITNTKLQFETFGDLESFYGFFKNQSSMQFIKRK